MVSLKFTLFYQCSSFFNRTILCNSYVWDCEYTGKTGCTYAAALKSEKEAQQQMETLPLSIQRVVLTLTHNSSRTAVSSLIEELFSYLKERYQVGEVLDYGSKK